MDSNAIISSELKRHRKEIDYQLQQISLCEKDLKKFYLQLTSTDSTPDEKDEAWTLIYAVSDKACTHKRLLKTQQELIFKKLPLVV